MEQQSPRRRVASMYVCVLLVIKKIYCARTFAEQMENCALENPDTFCALIKSIYFYG